MEQDADAQEQQGDAVVLEQTTTVPQNTAENGNEQPPQAPPAPVLEEPKEEPATPSKRPQPRGRRGRNARL